MRIKVFAVAAVFWTMSVCIASTSAAEEAPVQAPPVPIVTFQYMAVAPFLVVERRPEMEQIKDMTLTCSIGSLCVEEPALITEAAPTLAHLAEQQLHKRFDIYNIVPLSQVRAAYARISLNAENDTPVTLAGRLGKALGADFVLIGTVWRYRERGAIEALPNSPAAVGFALYLVQAKSGLMVWRSIYEGSQEPVFNNLLQAGKRIKMGITWLSAEQLAQHGMNEAFKSFPDNLMPVGGATVRP